MGELPVTVTSLTDQFGRGHRDLRVSLTDRCSMRCTYCMPEEFSDWIPGDHLLSADEIVEVVSIAVSCGIQTVRLTGGEPLLNPDVVNIVRRLAGLPDAPAISMTTNGLRLVQLAKPLADAGLSRVNVSLDTLDRQRFLDITKRDRLSEVLDGIAAAGDAGLHPAKVNTILQRGVNDDEAVPLLRHALANGWRLRFIEQMPLDAGGLWSRSAMVTADEILHDLSREFSLTPVPTRGSMPAEEFYVDGGPQIVGVIASVTRPFCGSCDRLRLTADGQIRNCLFARQETDIRATLRGASLSVAQRRARIAALFGASVDAKAVGHGINDPAFLQPARPMSAIGG